MMQGSKNNGLRIPENIAVVGFCNDVVSRIVTPKLTTINYPSAVMGEIAASNLINHLQGVASISATNTIVIKPELIVRESSRRISDV